ncbi:MAG: CHC2 zinc finger domain-containing protein [Phocaeicola sp.]
MTFTEDDINRIKDAADGRLLDVVQDHHELRKSGISYQGECPLCNASKKLTVTPSKDIVKCWSCQAGGKGALAYLMKFEKMDWPGALDYCARKFNVLLDEKPKKVIAPIKKMKKSSKEAKGQDTTSYCARMLAESGLTFEDVTASVFKSDDNKTIFQGPTFKPGTIDNQGKIAKGDDVIIEYYDLDGNPVTYYQKIGKKLGNGERREYYRVRWQHPDSHLDKAGKPFKYKSPVGSGTPIYIPEKLRKLYREQTEIPRLYIQEGEKKAEKACKHGIPSIAISGIQNLGNQGTLPEDVISIIQTCKVKEVALIFDSDWDDISTNIKINDNVERRPFCFFNAAKNFKEYMRTLKNRDIYVEVFVGHIHKNAENDKGLDDLLANSLKDRENELADDLEFACNEKKGQGKYVEMFKVTTWTDQKIKELWCLHSHESFAERHKEILQHLPEFRFGRYRWKFDDSDNVVLAQPFDEDEKFWNELEKTDRAGNVRTEIEFCYVNSQNFLQNRGFGRFRRLDKTFQFIHLDPPVVRAIEASDARDFLFQFAKYNCKKEVNEMLIKGVSQYVGPDKLSLLSFVEPNFVKATRDAQYFYFDKSCWYITRDCVEERGYESITHHIWEEQRKVTPARYLGKPLITFDIEENVHNYTISEEGRNSHYLQFLVNTSNFTWRKSAAEKDADEENENNIHLLSKLCAIGYMVMEAKDNNVSRAVIGMDGKLSEVGESNGRSGKSLVGELMRNVIATAYIPGKRSDMFNDQFIWNDVQENTKMVFIDDVLQNFNFEFLFPNITGDWSINYKGGRRITIPFAKSAKLYIATNHAIRGTGSSFTDRQWLLAFSDFYNDSHKPIDDFGCLFFSEWDYDQWNLTWNLLATCIQLYLKHGVIQAPGGRLEQRKLRQDITEPLIAWADEYFSEKTHLNSRLPKRELYESFCTYDPAQRKFISSTAFKNKFGKYCDFKGYTLNPQKYDKVTGKPHHYDKDGRPIIDDKSGGIEYFTVGTSDYFSVSEINQAEQQLLTTNNKIDF